jgi:hypothetical protein
MKLYCSVKMSPMSAAWFTVPYETHLKTKFWAASWQNQHSGLATSMNPDQPVHPRSLIRIHAVRLQTLLQVEKLIANSMDPDETHYVGFVVTRFKLYCFYFIKFVQSRNRSINPTKHESSVLLLLNTLNNEVLQA